MRNLKIAVINGGPSAEAEVSRSSAKGVIAALQENYDAVASMELNTELAKALEKFAPDVVFPVLHGPPGEDGTLQGFLETLEYSYVGSDVHGSAFAMDKVVAKAMFRRAGLPVIDEVVVDREDGVTAAVSDINHSLGEFVVVKPARQGSAVGVTLIDNAAQLHAGVENAFQYDRQLLVERRIVGKEITVGVLDTQDGTIPFPVIEITTPADSWYDYEHRYTAGLSDHLIPARLPAEQQTRLQDLAVRAHQVLGCRDLSRADFIVPNDDEEYILEVNTLPGMTPTSLYPDGARAYGKDFPALVSFLVERAADRR